MTRNAHREEITAKSEFLFQRLHLSVLCTLLTDWSFSLSAFDNVEAQGESNLITIRFSFSNQVEKIVISEYWKEIGQPPLSENFSLKCQIRIGLYGVKNLTFYEECMGSSTLLPTTNFAFYDGWYFLKYYMRTVKKWKSY